MAHCHRHCVQECAMVEKVGSHDPAGQSHDPDRGSHDPGGGSRDPEKKGSHGSMPLY